MEVFFGSPITERTARPSNLGLLPSSGNLQRWWASTGSKWHEYVRPPRAETRLKGYACDLVIDWLESSQYLLDVTLIKEAAESFAKILTRRAPLTKEELIAVTDFVSASVVRRARVRLDVVSMALFRCFWAGLDMETVNLCLFADTSPQYRGEEMLAATFDMFVGDQYRRTFFPICTISRSMLGVVGKAFDILWLIFLMAGPSFYTVVAFTDRVRSFTTDCGIERMVAVLPDLVVSILYL